MIVRTDERLQALLDRQEIVDVLVRFCRGVDRLDGQLIRSCFHSDALDDHGMFRGGPHELAEYLVRSARRMVASQHYITNATIAVDGDRAGSESYVTAMLRMRRQGTGHADHHLFARYVDRFERRGGGPWLIAERTVVYDLTRIDPVEGEWRLGEGYTLGVRGAEDPSYGIL